MSRRTVLRGLGTAVALPLLDAMVPALTAQANTPAKAVRRLGVVYHPNGVIYENWLPKGVGPRLRVLAHARAARAVPRSADRRHRSLQSSGGGARRRRRRSLARVRLVSDRRPRQEVRQRRRERHLDGPDRRARRSRSETQLSSLQLTADDNSLVGSCDVGYSCAYSSTLSWLTPTLPLMAENNPRVVFERLFGSSDSTDARVRASRLRQDRSILDSVTARVKQLQQKLGRDGQHAS